MKTDVVQSELEALCLALGLTVYDLRYRQEKLVVMLDRSPKPLNLDELAETSNILSAFLETRSDLLAILGNFELEVTTPGLERPLLRMQHFQQVIGKKIAIKLKRALGGKRRLWGVLAYADESEIKVTDVTDSEPSTVSSGTAARKRTTGAKVASGVEEKTDVLYATDLESINHSIVLANYQGIVLRLEDIEEAHLYFDWRAALSKAESFAEDIDDSNTVDDLGFSADEDLSASLDQMPAKRIAEDPSQPRQTDCLSETANGDIDRRVNNGKQF